MRICVYCSSSDSVDDAYVRVAHDLACTMAARGHTLIYGGASVGLMGEVARTMSACGGHVTGIIPRSMTQVEMLNADADQVIITDTMAERKAEMILRADAFVALPGGFGTLEEFSEVLTLKQLGILTQGLVLLNAHAFYEPLVAFFEQLYSLGFVRPQYRSLYHLAADAEAALNYLEGYTPASLPEKWF